MKRPTRQPFTVQRISTTSPGIRRAPQGIAISSPSSPWGTIDMPSTRRAPLTMPVVDFASGFSKTFRCAQRPQPSSWSRTMAALAISPVMPRLFLRRLFAAE